MSPRDPENNATKFTRLACALPRRFVLDVPLSVAHAIHSEQNHEYDGIARRAGRPSLRPRRSLEEYKDVRGGRRIERGRHYSERQECRQISSVRPLPLPILAKF